MLKSTYLLACLLVTFESTEIKQTSFDFSFFLFLFVFVLLLSPQKNLIFFLCLMFWGFVFWFWFLIFCCFVENSGEWMNVRLLIIEGRSKFFCRLEVFSSACLSFIYYFGMMSCVCTCITQCMYVRCTVQSDSCKEYAHGYTCLYISKSLTSNQLHFADRHAGGHEQTNSPINPWFWSHN